MKSWVVNYAVRFKDGRTEDHRTDFKAERIQEALGEAQKLIDSILEAEEVERAVIWAVEMVEMDVF